MLFAEADLEIGFDSLGWKEDQDPEYFGSQRTFAAYDVSADIIFKKKNVRLGQWQIHKKLITRNLKRKIKLKKKNQIEEENSK